jgi:2-amino-4-hydroxy-6-hydroxymethyldihydropteridine diphosphokinase
MNYNIFLLLGTNLGDRSQNLKLAREKVGAFGKIVKTSSIYTTEAWGKTDQPSFYNQVLQIESELNPQNLLASLLETEKEIGRVRLEKWGPRIIDIDLLFYGNHIISGDDLIVPHPGIPHRRFTLLPLYEIAPELMHPSLKKNISTLLNECTDTLPVEKI